MRRSDFIFVALEDALRSGFYSMQSSSLFLDVNDKLKTLEVFDHKKLG
jgi:hypothetical protein